MNRETLDHINRVRELLAQVMRELRQRSRSHDRSKLEEPEKSGFEQFTPLLREVEYGSDEYYATLKRMQPFLEHHYTVSRHHPEYFEQGWRDMNIVDVLEMLADWKAAGERHKSGGDLDRSISQNRERFGYTPEFEGLLRNTARDFGWL